MSSRVAIVVPWRSGVAERERAWAWCRQWWEQFGWPIFEVEHPPPEPFNRAFCINEGARRAWPWDILIAIDADVFEADGAQVIDGVQSAAETGRLTIPHTVGADLNTRGTQALLGGKPGWENALHKRRDVCTSRVWIMRADLLEAVGGFDERFRGWGHEDVAAFHSMRNLRGVDQAPGTCYHLWHEPSFPKARRTKEWAAGNTLVQRYLTADRQGWPAIEPILAERAPEERWDRPDGNEPPPRRVPETPPADRAVDVICLTAGRQEYLTRTLASFTERVHGTIANRTIIDDSGNERYGRWLKSRYPDWEIHSTGGKTGFTKAIRAAWWHERHRAKGSPYIFHLEEDFVFDRDVDLGEDMIPILERNRKIAQVALLRAPFFPPEIEAGSIINEDPGAYEQQTDGERTWLVHQKFFTTNPSVYRRSLIMSAQWPNVRHSETAFTRRMVQRGHRFAFLGEGDSYVTHIGVERTNHGY